MYQLNVPETVLVGVSLGVVLAFSVRRQYWLQKIGLHDETKSPLFERITYCALSLAIMLLAVVVGKTISALEKYDFLLVVLAACGAMWAVFYLQRSNRQFDRDA
jgi:hypothetical protein